MNEFLFRQAPRVPRLRAPIVYGSPREVLATLGWALLALAVVVLVWSLILFPLVWLFGRLHH